MEIHVLEIDEMCCKELHIDSQYLLDSVVICFHFISKGGRLFLKHQLAIMAIMAIMASQNRRVQSPGPQASPI